MATAFDLPVPIRVNETNEELRCVLPRRTGWIYRLFGGVITLVGLAASGGLAALALYVGGHGQTRSWALVLVLALAALCSLVVLFVGLQYMAGRIELGIDHNRLWVRESVGGLGWSRRVPLDRLRYLKVGEGQMQVDGRPVPALTFGYYSALVAVVKKRPPQVLASGYPKEWLEQLARVLSDRIETVRHKRPAVYEETWHTTRALTRGLEQPEGSEIRVEPIADGIRLVIPAPGLLKGGKAFVPLWGIWGLVSLIISLVVTPWSGSGDPTMPGLACAGTLVGVWGGWMVIGLLIVRRGCMRAMVEANPRWLRVAMVSPFGKRVLSVPRTEIKTVQVGQCNFEIGDTSPLELKIRRKGGMRELGLFSNLSDEELYWLASVLRGALGMDGVDSVTIPNFSPGNPSRSQAA